MTTYAFPSITPSTSTWAYTPNTRAYRSPLTNSIQTVGRKGSLWHVTLQFNNLDEAQRAEMQAFLVRLNGQQHRFTLNDHAYTRRGTGGGSPKVDVAGQTGGSLNLRDAAVSVTPWLMAGDYFSVANELKMVVADCNSDGDGDVPVFFQPNLRTSPADGAVVDITAPVNGVFILASDPKWDNRPGIFSSFGLEAFEDVLA